MPMPAPAIRARRHIEARAPGRHIDGRQSTSITKKYGSPVIATGITPNSIASELVVTLMQLTTPVSGQASVAGLV
jgi:hypothetical protein